MSTPVHSPDERQKLAEVSSEVSAVVARARAIEVATPQQAQDAFAFLTEIKAAKDRSERARRFLVDPLNAHVRAINDRIKSDVAPLIEADGLVRAKVLAFHKQAARAREREQARLDEERRVAQEQAQAARRAAQEQAAAAEREAQGSERAIAARREAEEALQRQIATQAAPAIQVAAPPLADNGSAAVRRDWRATVVDPALVPRQYLKVDQTAINAAVRAGVREIEGVRIEQVTGLAVRAR